MDGTVFRTLVARSRNGNTHSVADMAFMRHDVGGFCGLRSDLDTVTGLRTMRKRKSKGTAASNTPARSAPAPRVKPKHGGSTTRLLNAPTDELPSMGAISESYYRLFGARPAHGGPDVRATQSKRRAAALLWHGGIGALEFHIFAELVRLIWHASRDNPSAHHTELFDRIVDVLHSVELRRARMVWLVDEAVRRYASAVSMRTLENEPDDAAVAESAHFICEKAAQLEPRFGKLQHAYVSAEFGKLVSFGPLIHWYANHDPITIERRVARLKSSTKPIRSARARAKRIPPPAPTRRGRGALSEIGLAAKLSVSVGAFGDGGTHKRGTPALKAAGQAYRAALSALKVL